MRNLNSEERKRLGEIAAKVNDLGLAVRGLHSEDDAPKTHPLWKASNHIMHAVEEIQKFLRKKD